MSRVRIDIVVFDGLDELDALGPFEVFANAGRAATGLDVRLVSRVPQAVVEGAHGLRFEPAGAIEPGADILVVPGGGWASRSAAGAWAEAQSGELPLAVREMATADRPRLVAGVCTGTMLLAHAGIVGSRRATTHHSAWADLEATGAQVVKERVVDDGDLVTSGGVTSGIDLALWIVEREIGRDVADGVASAMEYPRFRPQLSGFSPK
jgi:transcriptional regulator GlxA family with amidase domain